MEYPYMYTKGKQPHQLLRNTKEWKLAVKKYIKDKCQWCGSTEHLQIHHLKNTILYKSMWYTAIYEIEKEYIKLYEENNTTQAIVSTFLYYLFERRCPRCGYKLPFRKVKLPECVCRRCNMEYNMEDLLHPIHRYNTILLAYRYHVMPLFRGRLRKYVIKYKFEDIKKEYNLKVQKALEYYMEMKDIITLCRRCHKAYHSGRVLCECGKNYRTKRWTECVECAIEKGKIKYCIHCKKLKQIRNLNSKGYCTDCQTDILESEVIEPDDIEEFHCID